MDTHLGGIISHVVSIFATNVLITTTEGNVDRTTLIFLYIINMFQYFYSMVTFKVLFHQGHKINFSLFFPLAVTKMAMRFLLHGRRCGLVTGKVNPV